MLRQWRWLIAWCGALLCCGLAMSCQGGRCFNVCPASIVRCVPNGLETCVANPTNGCTEWAFTQCRPGEACSIKSGTCVPSGAGQCQRAQHEKRCVGNALYWFDDCGQQRDFIQQCTSSCQSGQCTGGQQCQDACRIGQSRCSPEGWLSSCTRSPQTACMIWGPPTVCPGNLRCQGDRCPSGGQCQGKSDCQAGTQQCQGDSIQGCQKQADGCYRWGQATGCPSGQVCRNGACAVPGQQCPASCSNDGQCKVPACGGRTSCYQFSCQVPQAQCPASCSNDSECRVAACGTKTSCQGGKCSEPQAQCPASCTSKSDCQVAACGTKTECRGGQCAEPSQMTAAEQDLLDALNRARKANNLPAVAIDMKLMCTARVHAKDVGATGSCGHVGSDGSWPWDRAKRCGFAQQKWTVNEIAAGPGFRDGDDAVRGWRASSGHWAAIVHPQAKTVGVAVFKSCYIAVFDCCVKGSD